MAYKKVPPAQCACGCGQWITRMMHNGKIRIFKPGHHKVKDGKPRHSEIFHCKGCDFIGPRHGRKNYCSRKCYWKHRGWNLRPESEQKLPGRKTWDDRSTFRVCTSARIQRLYMLAACEDKCEICGWDRIVEVLEVHHLNRDKKDGRRENMLLLCPNCHEEQHFKEKSGRYNPSRYKDAAVATHNFLVKHSEGGVS